MVIGIIQGSLPFQITRNTQVRTDRQLDSPIEYFRIIESSRTYSLGNDRNSGFREDIVRILVVKFDASWKFMTEQGGIQTDIVSARFFPG